MVCKIPFLFFNIKHFYVAGHDTRLHHIQQLKVLCNNLKNDNLVLKKKENCSLQFYSVAVFIFNYCCQQSIKKYTQIELQFYNPIIFSLMFKIFKIFPLCRLLRLRRWLSTLHRLSTFCLASVRFALSGKTLHLNAQTTE